MYWSTYRKSPVRAYPGRYLAGAPASPLRPTGLALVTIWYGPIVQAFLPGHTCGQRRNTTHALARLLYLSKAPNILLPFLSPYPHINPLDVSSFRLSDLVCVYVGLHSQARLSSHLHTLLVHTISSSSSSLHSSPPSQPVKFSWYLPPFLTLLRQIRDSF